MKQSINQRQFTAQSVTEYLESLNGHKACQLYNLVINETEKGLIKAVIEWAEGNQSKAAEMLGITRTTLRNKIRKHRL